MLSRRFEEALVYAAGLHATQTRKGSGIPYVTHLLAVAGLTLEYGGNENEAIAALLHDAIEDQGGEPTRQEILRRFGPAVTAIVDGCTHPEDVDPWRIRRELQVESLANAPHSVRLVSACDKLHNVRTLVMDYRRHGEALWSRFHGAREGTLWYYRALVDALRAAGVQDVVAELDRAVTELESLASGVRD